MDSYYNTIILIVFTFSINLLKLIEAGFNGRLFLGGVANSNGGFWLCEWPGLARISGFLVDGMTLLTKSFSC